MGVFLAIHLLFTKYNVRQTYPLYGGEPLITFMDTDFSRENPRLLRLSATQSLTWHEFRLSSCHSSSFSLTTIRLIQVEKQNYYLPLCIRQYRWQTWVFDHSRVWWTERLSGLLDRLSNNSLDNFWLLNVVSSRQGCTCSTGVMVSTCLSEWCTVSCWAHERTSAETRVRSNCSHYQRSEDRHWSTHSCWWNSDRVAAFSM